jgi:hypothetical protein
MQFRALLVMASLVAAPTFAQTAPAMPSAAKDAPPLRLPYASAFADYRPWRDVDALPWAKANQDVGTVGGHAGMLRGAAPADGPRTPTAQPGAKQ